ncbi:Uncharacterized protein BP5553_01705 [Venustampulla echinocandica]|uniref:Protein HRI1 n=1 Tax=Venustampulla echinocandica TaxID=2656787 RepID=A0A370U1S3_9HELO|nr:Uncharacterized protein BP5553_01705 [Venustampulla echinocandica]RDL41726.1 Uncharacterized protein BP5553_01705 [Venustampulla echinocandica]
MTPREKIPSKFTPPSPPTLVLTSAAKYFVDTRIYLPTSPSEACLPTSVQLPDSRLEWGFAGTAKSTAAIYNPDTAELEKAAHTEWTHWVDNKTTEEVRDEGYMYPKDDGSDEVLELGEMVNPARGQVEKYEECWVDLDSVMIPGDQQFLSWVLRTVERGSDEGEVVKGMIMKVGQYVQGVLRKGEEFGVRRWNWGVENDVSGWRSTARIGQLDFPIGEDNLGMKMLPGIKIKGADGIEWECVEVFNWS